MARTKKQPLGTRIKNTCIIILALLVVYTMHSILCFVNTVVPFPILVGMVGGFFLGTVYNISQKKDAK